MATMPESIVPVVSGPDVGESHIRRPDVVVPETLLIDRTMTALNGGSPVNIKWAADDCARAYLGKTGYAARCDSAGLLNVGDESMTKFEMKG